ncbi:cytochrome p450 domain-containing protein [Ditylenchus destructor]|nr:cytochrome p450 domain-containing protein [Ditylenchus destructor]
MEFVRLVDKIPGPPALPFIGCAHMFRLKIEDFAAQMFEYPESVKTVLESTIVIRKGTEYKIMERWLGTGLLTSTGDKWRTRRKMITPAFHFNVLNSFLSVHDKEAQIFISQLEKYADSGQAFDMYPYFKRLTLDIICETSMGVKINAQTNHSHRYIQAVKRINELSFLYSRMPWLWIKPIWYACGYGKEYDQCLKLLTDFTRMVISNRRKTLEEERGQNPANLNMNQLRGRSAFLDLLLHYQREDKTLSDEDIREEVDTFMFEGHDTTASGMAWSIWCLANHPEYQDKVVKEIDDVFGDSTKPCTNDDLKELKYLEKCIKETMRLFPPVPIFTRTVEDKNFECLGYKIPPGCTLLISPMVLQRCTKIYDNANDFDPENFSAERIASRHPFAYIPFSAGPRNCIGQKFALMEEKTVLSWFFRRYTVKPAVGYYESFPCPEITLRPSNGIPVHITRRVHLDQNYK